MAERRPWTREELILAVNLYCKTPFGKIHHRNPAIVELARLIGRTPSALTWKLSNFASFDPSLQNRGIKGAQHASKLDKAIWEEFFEDWESLALQSELLLMKQQKGLPANFLEEKEGKNVERTVKARLNQSFFRSTLLASYENRCCITGLQETDLLIASHIKPWSIDAKNRLNPRNGLLLNALHDKAFELGYLTITPDYKIHISSHLLKSKEQEHKSYFKKYHLQDIYLPQRFLPDTVFLEYHNQERFRQ